MSDAQTNAANADRGACHWCGGVGEHTLVMLPTGYVWCPVRQGRDQRERELSDTPRDWPAFWRSLPPREMLEAAKAMPKIAGPWQLYADGYWIREDPAYGGGGLAARQPFDGRASADAALRAAGWSLVDADEEHHEGR